MPPQAWAAIGTNTKPAVAVDLMLPFGGGATWRCDQGNGDCDPTHCPGGSMEYAWDFNLGGGDDDLGEPVVAPASGTIVYTYSDSGYNGGWGNTAIIDYDGGNYGMICHLDTVLVVETDTVTQGQQIGTCGKTGNAPTAHIHYQTQNGPNTWNSSIQSTFVDAEEPDFIPKAGGFYTSMNCYNPTNDHRVGRYVDGYVLENVSDYRPYSRPFAVTYYHNDGADMLGYPISDVYLLENCMGCDEFGADFVYVQDFQGGDCGSATLVMNMLTYNTRFEYPGVVYPIHGHIRDYWYLHFSELGAPVSNEHGYDGSNYYSSSNPAYVVQWFERSENNYVAVVYNNTNGTFQQYDELDPGAPPCTVLDQAKWDNLGCPGGVCGTGGGGDPPDPYIPVADFFVSTTSGVIPLSVEFIDGSSGEITSWYWDFDDGRDSEEQNIGLTFYQPGIYDVELTVSGPYGSDSRVRTITALDHPNPEVHFSDLMSGPEFQVNTHINDNQGDPAVIGLAGGGFKIIWYSEDPSHRGWYGQEFDQYGNKLGSEFSVTSMNDRQARPAIAKLNNGNYVVVWDEIEWDGSDYSYESYAQLYDANGDAIGNNFRVNTYTQYGQLCPSVDALSDGGFVVVWQSWQDGSEYGIYGQRFNDSGEKVGSEFRVNTHTNDEQSGPIVSGLNNGGFAVVWYSDNQDGSSWGIYGQVFDSNGSKIGSEIPINTYTNYRQSLPRVAGLSDGGFVAVWESDEQDGNYYGVYGQLFDSYGNKEGDEFQINTFVDWSQYRPAVAGLTDGGFIVTWESSDQDGSGAGIYGQLFGVDIVLPPNPDLDPPAPWVLSDIGSPNIAGEAIYQSDTGVFEIASSGHDIWGTGDQFTFLHQLLSGDGEIIARVTAQDYTGDWAKAGVIIKESTTEGSPYALMAITPANGYAFQYNFDGHASGGDYTLPNAWVKLVRNGDLLTGYVSSDGSNWDQAGSAIVTMPTDVQIGLFVTSNNGLEFCTVTFDNVTITSTPAGPGEDLPEPWLEANIGDPTLTGNASYNEANGSFTIEGSGHDIWETTDQFYYVYQPLTGDGEITARVLLQNSSEDWAKAGVMIKESTIAGASNALLAVTPANGIAFQYEFYNHISGGSYTFPVWLKLMRSGNNIAAYTSPDGSNWSEVGSTVITMTDNATAGLFVTSHNGAVLDTVEFDNVSVAESSNGTGEIELLDAPWNLSGNNGADEKYQSVDANILNGRESVTITYDLHGLCALGGDASAIIFDQNGWQYISLSDYGTNCYDGEQTVTIPLSDFSGLDPESALTGSLHTRFWYGSAFAVDIISIKLNADNPPD